MSIITVDTNAGEDRLFNGLLRVFGEDRVKRRRLDIGDLDIDGPNGRIVIERKTWNDLCASLRSSNGRPPRYQEQKANMLAARERAYADGTILKGCVLIEARQVPSLAGSTHGMKNAAPLAALKKMALRDGINVVFSADAGDSFQHVEYIIRAHDVNGFDSKIKLEEHKAGGYASFVKHAGKRKNMENHENSFAIMLTTINGLTASTAQAIIEKFPTPLTLFRAYDALTATGANMSVLDDMLADVALPQKQNGKKNKARVGPALSKLVREVFYTL